MATQRSKSMRTLATAALPLALLLALLPAALTVQASGWIEEAKLLADDGASTDNFGESAAVSGDAALLGAPGDDSDTGSAYVFVGTDGAWTRQKLSASDGATGDDFGVSVALSGDTALVGAAGDETNTGAFYYFHGSGTTWHQFDKLTASDGSTGDEFGIAVAISGDTALIGARGHDSNKGAAYVFTRSGITWSLQQKLTASDAAASDLFGTSVALDGDIAVIGASGDESSQGAAYVFNRIGSTWTQQAKLTASDGASSDYFGVSVALSGYCALVGATGDDDLGSSSGSAYLFERAGGTTWFQRAKLTASDGASDDFFGISVALTGSTEVGSTILVGAHGDDDLGSFSGSAYVFTRIRNPNTTFPQVAKLTASDGAGGERFGRAVALSGDAGVVGAYQDDDNGSGSGSAYVFRGHVHWGASWGGSGTGLTLASTDDTGLEVYSLADSSNGINATTSATTGAAYGLYGTSAAPSGGGVYGFASATTGTPYGVLGWTGAPSGHGVHGRASALTGTNYGVYGESYSTEGRGVYGHVNTPSGVTYGVYGQSDSTSGYGVYGIAGQGSGTTYGVYGRSNAPSGHGVYGYADASSGTTYGVRGQARSTSGRGVYGYVGSSSGGTIGVLGRSNSTSGRGVYGIAAANSGFNDGVRGLTSSTSGRGVSGIATAGSGATYGVLGQTNSTSGRGVYGYAITTSGTNYGLYGRTNSSSGRGVYGYASSSSGTTYGLYGRVSSANGWAGMFDGSGHGVYISVPGGKTGLNVASGTKSAVVATSQGSRLLYAEESTEVWFTDHGFGQLSDGVARVPINPLFAETVNLQEPYLVFLQEFGDAELYVSERGQEAFEVRLRDGDPNVQFGYRLMAKRRGHEKDFLEHAPWADDDPNLYPEKRAAWEAQEAELHALPPDEPEIGMEMEIESGEEESTEPAMPETSAPADGVSEVTFDDGEVPYQAPVASQPAAAEPAPSHPVYIPLVD